MVATFRMDRTKMRLLSGFIGASARLSEQEHAALLQDIASLPRSERDRVMPVTIGWVEYGRAQGIEQGRAEGIERGIEQGIEQGMERGRVSGVQDLLLRLGERRFGPPPPDLLAFIEAIGNTTRLEDLVLRVDDAESWQDLLSRADLLPSSG